MKVIAYSCERCTGVFFYLTEAHHSCPHCETGTYMKKVGLVNMPVMFDNLMEMSDEEIAERLIGVKPREAT